MPLITTYEHFYNKLIHSFPFILISREKLYFIFAILVNGKMSSELFRQLDYLLTKWQNSEDCPFQILNLIHIFPVKTCVLGLGASVLEVSYCFSIQRNNVQFFIKNKDLLLLI